LVPFVPDVPFVPEVPLVPLVPELPDVPDVPLVPEEPLVPEVPDVPEEPLVPDVPLVPEVPELPFSVDALIVCNWPVWSIVTTKGSLDMVNPETKICPALPSLTLFTPFVLRNNSSADE
jgi:hypothetical protein